MNFPVKLNSIFENMFAAIIFFLSFIICFWKKKGLIQTHRHGLIAMQYSLTIAAKYFFFSRALLLS
jgi:hypothetical protein